MTTSLYWSIAQVDLLDDQNGASKPSVALPSSDSPLQRHCLSHRWRIPIYSDREHSCSHARKTRRYAERMQRNTTFPTVFFHFVRLRKIYSVEWSLAIMDWSLILSAVGRWPEMLLVHRIRRQQPRCWVSHLPVDRRLHVSHSSTLRLDFTETLSQELILAKASGVRATAVLPFYLDGGVYTTLRK